MRTFARENVYKAIDDDNERKASELKDLGFVEVFKEEKPVAKQLEHKTAEQTDKKPVRHGRKGKR